MPKGRLAMIIGIFGMTLLWVCFWAPYGFVNNSANAASLKDIFIKRLEEEFPIRVTCGSLQFRGGKIELKDLRIQTLDKKPLLQVPVTKAGVDLWRLLLHPTSMKNALTRLDFINPTVYLSQDAKGRWNFESLTRLRKKEGMDLKIGVENGKVELPKEISGWRPGYLYAINGELNLAKNRRVGWKIIGRTTKDARIAIVSEGTMNPAKTNGQINLKLQNLQLEQVEKEVSNRFNLAKWGVSDLSGQGNADVRLRQTPKGWTWEADCSLDNAGVRWEKMSEPVSEISGTVRAYPSHIRLDGLRGRIGRAILRVEGEVNLSGKEAGREMNIQLNNFDLATIKPIHPLMASWRAEGQADLRLRLSGSLKEPQIRGEVRLSELSGREPSRGWRISKVESLVTLTDEGIRIGYLRGFLEDSRVEATGYLRDWKNFRWDLQLKATQFEPNRLWPRLPLQVGELAGEATLTGPLGQPDIHWKASTEKLIWDRLESHDLKAEGSYLARNGLVRVDSLRMGIGKAWIEGKGSGQTRGRNPQFSFDISASGIELADLPSMMGSTPWAAKIPPLSGTFDFNLKGKGGLGDWKTWEVQGDFRGINGRIPAMRFQRFSGKIGLASGKVKAENIVLEQPDGKLILNGDWSAESGLVGDAEAENLIFDAVVPGKLSKKISGAASGRINFSDSRSAGSYSGGGILAIDHLAIDDHAVGHLRLKTLLENSLLHLDGSNLQTVEGGTVELTGYVTTDIQNPTIEMKVRSDNLSLSSLQPWLPMKTPVVLEGNLRTDLHLNGRLVKPNVSGTIGSDNIKVAGHSLGTTEIDLTWQNEKLLINQATLRQNEGILSLKGFLGLEGSDLAVTAVQYPLNGLAFSLGGVPVQGTLNFSGQVLGTLTNPIARGDIAVNALNLGGIQFRRVAGVVAWKDRTLSMENVLAEQGEQRLNVQGDITFGKTPEADLALKMDATHLRDLLLVIGLRPRIPMDGVISGDLTLRGPLSAPHIRLNAALQNGFIRGYSQLAGMMDLEIVGKSIEVHRLELKGPNGALAADGLYEPGKRAMIRLSLDDFDLKPAAEGIKAAETLEGHVDLRANLDYGASGLQGQISGRIREAKWRKILLPVTELEGNIENNMVSLNLEQRDLGLHVSGNGPIDPSWFRWLQLPKAQVNMDTPIFWELSAPHITGEMVEKIFPRVESASGSVGLKLTVGGTWRAPETTGEIDVKHLSGRVSLLPESFSDVNGKIRINDNKLEIINLSSKYGKGSAEIGGGLSLKGIIPEELNLELKLKRFHYKNSSFDGFINAEGRLSGPLRDSLVTGNAVLYNSRVAIVKGKRRNYFNPRLDLEVKLGKDNYFHQIGLANILVNGSVHVGGTLTQPTLDGTISSNHGTATIYGTTFRLVDAAAEFTPKEGIYPYVSGHGVTRSKNVEIHVYVEGWTSKIVDIRFDSVPKKTNDEILALLHWSEINGSGLSLIQGNMNSIMDSVLGSTLDQFKDTLHLDFFDLEQEQVAGPVRLNIGKSVSDNLFVTYSRTFDSSTENIWSIEYSLTPNISFLGEFSDEEGSLYQLNFHFRF